MGDSHSSTLRLFDPKSRMELGYRQMESKTILLMCSLFSIGVAACFAQPSTPSQLAPVESFSLPWEIDRDFGATNGDATIMRIMPLYHIKVNEAWRITNLDLVSIADAPGGRCRPAGKSQRYPRRPRLRPR